MIEINNRTRTAVSEDFLRKVASDVLKGEKKSDVHVSIALVGAKRAAALNEQYRKKDNVANVLSFPAGDDRIPSEVEGYLGEIVLCPQQVEKDGRKYGMIFKKALAWMLIHGVLHLLGYDHEQEKDAQKMEQKESWYLSRIKKF